MRELVITADLERFEASADQVLELGRRVGWPWYYLWIVLRGMAQFWKGQPEEAQGSFREAIELEPPGWYLGTGWAFLFLGTAYLGDKNAALAMLEEKRGDLPRRGNASLVGRWNMLLAAVEGLCVLEERDEAAELYPLVLEAIDTGALMARFDCRLSQTVAGMAAAAAGQWERAEEHYRTALRQARELPHKIEQPEVRRWYARMLVDRDGPGDRDRALQLLAEALPMYREIGMPKHVEMAEALLHEAS